MAVCLCLFHARVKRASITAPSSIRHPVPGFPYLWSHGGRPDARVGLLVSGVLHIPSLVTVSVNGNPSQNHRCLKLEESGISSSSL